MSGVALVLVTACAAWLVLTSLLLTSSSVPAAAAVCGVDRLQKVADEAIKAEFGISFGQVRVAVLIDDDVCCSVVHMV